MWKLLLIYKIESLLSKYLFVVDTYDLIKSCHGTKKMIGTSGLIRRQIDKYDGVNISIGSQVVYELGNFLGSGATGSVYQAVDLQSLNQNREIAIKILTPKGYKLVPPAILNKCIVVKKGEPLTTDQTSGRAPLKSENVWWLYNHSIKQVIAAYEDHLRGRQMRELTLPKCIEIWGMTPFGEKLTEVEQDKINEGNGRVAISDSLSIVVPLVPFKYLKWLRERQSVCREMSNMFHLGEHPNLIDLYEVLELINESKSTLFLVLELAQGGMLFDRMKNTAGGTPEEFARKYFIQLISGINYCHEKGKLNDTSVFFLICVRI